MSGSVARSPSLVAREAIRQLALRRIPPTPDNYADLYAEVSGERDRWCAEAAPRMLARFAAEAMRLSPRFAPAAAQLERAVAERDWQRARTQLLALLACVDEGDWGDLIARLIRQCELRHRGLTPAQKRHALEHVLVATSGNADRLFRRLEALVRSWAETPLAVEPALGATEPAGGTPAQGAPVRREEDLAGDADTAALLELVAQAIEIAVAENLGHHDGHRADARSLAGRIRRAATREELAAAVGALRSFLLRLELSGDTPATLIEALVRVLTLLVDGLGECVGDEPPLAAEVTRIREALGGSLDARTLAEAERVLRDVVLRQGVLRHSLGETKDALKQLLATFLDRLGTMARATGGFHDDLARFSTELAAARDVQSIRAVVEAVMQRTRGMQADIVRTVEELAAAREQVDRMQARVLQLERELEHAARLVRQDPLTGVLNRRGFEEAYAVETARCDREGRPLALAVLDVDNFKALNDTLGHAAGDGALQHLAAAVSEKLRPTDVVARYGGEEFVILLPGAGESEAAAVMLRVQRALTRRIFLHNNERILVTFSAGVALRQPGEPAGDLIARADAALYEAKRLGKNRVVTASACAGEPAQASAHAH